MGFSASIWALASALLSPLTVATPAVAMTPGLETGRQSGDPPLPEFLVVLWNELWGIDPVAGVSGMIFVSEVENQRWLVHAIERDEELGHVVVGVGFFDELERVEIWQDHWEDPEYDLTIAMLGVRGVLTGSTGVAYDVAGVVQRTRAVHAELGEFITDGFLPLEVIRRVARQISPDTRTNISQLTGECTDAFLIPGATCSGAWSTCKACCWDEFIDASQICFLVAVACIAAWAALCTPTALIWWACFVGASAACIALEAVCMRGAYRGWTSCKTRCDNARRMCEPGWTPPICVLIGPPGSDTEDYEQCRWPR